MGNWPKCPYYLGDGIKRDYITCEDSRHYHDSIEDKDKYLEEYCCSDRWQSCEHAIGLDQLYERTEDMAEDKARIEHLMHQVKAQEREAVRIRKENTRLQKIHAADEHLKENLHLYEMQIKILRADKKNLMTHNEMLTKCIGYLMHLQDMQVMDLTSMHEWSADHNVSFEVSKEKMTEHNMLSIEIENKREGKKEDASDT